MTEFVLRVRHAIYRTFADGGVPLSAILADTLTVPVEEIRQAYSRLHDAHAIVVDPHSREVRMALPFSAVPTPHRVVSGARSWYANCAWDAFAIPALMNCDARCESSCPDCDAAIAYRIDRGRLLDPHGVVHFAVPAVKWWDDIVFT